jgi:hypothetical protein
VWSAVLLLLLRTLSACTFVFVSINARVFIRPVVQGDVASKATPTPFTTRSRSADSSSSKSSRDGRRVSTSNHKRNSQYASIHPFSILPNPYSPSFLPTNQQHIAPSPPPNPPQTTQGNQIQTPFTNPTFTITPSKPESLPSHAALMKLYEDIIASDAQTIQVQEATIHSQQEVIRSQRDVVLRLQRLVDAQNAWIGEHCGDATSM